MAFSKSTNVPESLLAYWRRVLRPLSWWLLLVLVLYGIRLHQRLSAKTDLEFTTAVEGQTSAMDAMEGEARLDGKPFLSGQWLRIGWHKLDLTQPNGYPLTTNLFVWYGEHNLGKITLERTKGTLFIKVAPAAERIVVRGPEFAITLSNSTGFNSRVPTDRYQIETFYKFWKSDETVAVNTDATATYNLAPHFGAVSITAIQPDVAFELHDSAGAFIESGKLPTTITGLPEGRGYRLQTTRKEDRQESQFAVLNAQTNDLKVEFVYGVVTIESTPAGATVLKDGKEQGITPLTFPEVQPGPFMFTLRLDEYEPASAILVVTANQTNTFGTNLVSQHFTRAMKDARRFYANSAFDRAIEAVTEALKHKPGDADATNLLCEATIQSHLASAELLANQGAFTNAITEVNLALALAPENTRAKELLTDFTNREQSRLEAIRKREAELAEQARLQRERELAEQQARQRLREFRETFSALNDTYENAAQFSAHELQASNSINKVGDNLVAALGDSPITFDNWQLKWVSSHLFIMQPRQRIGVGYRGFLIVGCQPRDNEVQIRFKVYEYEHPPKINLLGGFLQVNPQVSVTSQDPQAAAANAQKFQARIRAGVDLATKLIGNAIN